MRKSILATLTGLIAVLGFLAFPTSSASAAGVANLYQQASFLGDPAVVPEASIPTSCSTIPASLPTVRSAENFTNGPGTTVAFFPASDTTCASAIVTLLPGQTAPNIQDPANPAQGAGRWMAVG